ncbi:dienelactone hydrolase family protein [Lineolata rhizophorae]|uniref:Dienelactone hydrolase family protein n=1 Tax=Lineolata rhizophorae TaxID=578093 RepID=A0A6A6P8M0_9PEZI|nr:dienelactone hydrolase family protein [Lineolata rhizophorae]
MAVSSCCLKGFQWDGTPTGHTGKLADNDAYITGDNPSAGVLVIHDLLGWTWPNIRLLADHYAREASATVYVPDFFGGKVIPFEPVARGRWDEVDVAGFMQGNGREDREPEMAACARALRERHGRVGAVGFCYGGWAVFRLGAKPAGGGPPLVDCISAGHPSLLAKADVDGVAAPTQVLAPEIDPAYSPELKSYTFDTLQRRGVPFDYQHFPGVEHACFSRGDPGKAGERDAMVRGKNAVVAWLRQFLLD